MSDTLKAKHCPNCACLLLQPVKENDEARTARVTELLRQNHPPLEAELSIFRDVAEETRATLEDLDSQILQAQGVLERLLSARKHAQSRLEDTKSLLHPMRSIPNELLTEIFHHCTPKKYRIEDCDVVDPKGAPWLLTRVCHRWRDLTISTPQLWTYLLLDFDKHECFITGRQCAYKVGLFLERSRGLPMTVYLESANSLRDHPVLPVLEVSIPRWRHLEVNLPRSSLQCLSGNNFLTLRALTLHDQDELEWTAEVDVFRSSSVPVLQTLEVKVGNSPGPFLECITLPRTNLTSITYSLVLNADDLKTLHMSPDLEALDVYVDIWEINTPFRNVLPLPKLRRLTISEGYNCPGRSAEFFSALTVPALSELSLHFLCTSIVQLPASPIPLENLTKLYITCDMNSHAENTQHLLEFLALTTHLEWLTIHDQAMTLDFVDGLNLNLADGSPARLPCLHFLDLSECRFAPVLNGDLDQLFEMVFSRIVEWKRGAEERVSAGVEAVKGIEGEFDARDSQDHRRCLRTVRFPRWLYVQARTEWSEVFLARVELECGVTTGDVDF